MVGLALRAADFRYLTAVSDPEALIAVISPIRISLRLRDHQHLCCWHLLAGVIFLHFG